MKLVQTIEPACCPPLLEDPVDVETADKLAAALRVLADPARVRLVNLIAARGSVGSCVCDLTEVLGLSQPTVSHHLKVLTDAGVLEREQRGRWAYFRLRPEPLELLSRALRVPVPA